jgi:hypothetical protein
MKYRFDGREKRLALGVYPTVTLKDARERREATKKLLSQGVREAEAKQTVGHDALMKRLSQKIKSVA